MPEVGLRQIVLADAADTVRLAHRLAALARPGDVFALDGDLGSGKTTLARAFVRALTTDDEDVPSPTFTLVQIYESRIGMIWHFDLYRVEHQDEMLELGLEDAFANGISLIEWPARLGPWLPAEHLSVHIRADAAGIRHVALAGGPAWSRRLDEAWSKGEFGGP